jgi:hypothetical protein
MSRLRIPLGTIRSTLDAIKLEFTPVGILYRRHSEPIGYEDSKSANSPRKVKPHVEKTFRLEEAARAMAVVEHGGSVGKIVLSLE